MGAWFGGDRWNEFFNIPLDSQQSDAIRNIGIAYLLGASLQVLEDYEPESGRRSSYWHSCEEVVEWLSGKLQVDRIWADCSLLFFDSLL
jgi:hypothetical protein